MSKSGEVIPRKERERREREELLQRFARESGLELSLPAAQVAAARARVPHGYLETTWFLFPNNDGEACRAVEMLRALGAPHLRVSEQGWGATLDREGLDAGELARELRVVGVVRAVILEIPGEEFERRLAAGGLQVEIVDHHDYAYVARAHRLSSLEQVMERLRWPASRTDEAIAVNDRSYIPGLKKLGLSEVEIRAVRTYDLLAQGRKARDLEKMQKEARELLPSLSELAGAYLLDHLGELEGYVKQELAIRSRDGRVDALTWEDRKLGFTGDPTVVDRLFARDFSDCGLVPGSFERYRGGDPDSSRYFGLKSATPLPRAVLEAAWKVLESR